MRSQVYRPGEFIIVDSLYLPKDRHGHGKAVLIADATSSKLSIFPVTNLKFESGDKYSNIFYVVLCIHGSARQIRLLNILRNYQITLQNTISAWKAAHLTTRVPLVRRKQVTTWQNWADTLPLIVNSLNQTFLYQNYTDKRREPTKTGHPSPSSPNRQNCFRFHASPK